MATPAAPRPSGWRPLNSTPKLAVLAAMKWWIPPTALALALSPLTGVYPVRVSGRSMEPTLQAGELRWALRRWCAGEPRRGQVWALEGPQGPAIKRVVGLPGEELVQQKSELWLQNRPLEEPYVTHPERGEDGPWQSGQGYFLLGDRRSESQDSRSWGPLPRSAFRGRILGL